MSLWSSTTIRADADCPRQAVWIRQGRAGKPWEGFLVGQEVHARAEAILRPPRVGTPPHLSVLQRVEVERLVAAAQKMGVLSPNPAAIVEQSYLVRLRDDGSFNDFPAEAPVWAVRGEKWNPAMASTFDGTYFRFQPDMWWHDHDTKTATIWDWKTALGMKADADIDRDVQVVTYAAAVAALSGAERVEIVLWNLRFQIGQRIGLTAAAAVERALPYFKACVDADAEADARHEADARPGEACGRCAFRDECLPTLAAVPEDASDDQSLYLRARALRAAAGLANDALKARAKARTSLLDLLDGTVLGPNSIPQLRWQKPKGEPSKKAQGLGEALFALQDAGLDWTEYFEPTKSLYKWVEAMPESVKALVLPLTNPSSLTTYIVRPNDDDEKEKSE